MLDGLDGINAAVPGLIQAFDAQIERRYREKRAAYEGLAQLQARYLLAATWLYEWKSGHPTAADSLLRLDPSMRAFILSREGVTSQQPDAAETALVTRLECISSMIDDLSTARATYLATQKELADLRIDLEQRISTARDIIIVWGQSHRNLGAGVPVPPLINLSSLASSAVHAALP